ncbi:DNA-binding transcriptional regulator, MerR family [Microlunatus soli]|uniref:DNA-binding transcriptional regulator, MerR family n=2 Tax=Microlunatus soli TaxID=630515 RepID=A0A1H1UX52_9ACTN|nr:DNA-binding transcriptional regulator, MerR family [Microlunatus soli]
MSSRLTISAFARTVGLTPSALRFYDDAGLLAPAAVDERNGYRYYDDDQRRRAVLVRQMRELDVPLTTMRAVLDGSPADAERLLTEHVDLLTGRADRARVELADLLRALRGTDDGLSPSMIGPTTFAIGGPELAGAIRQVAPFAAAPPTTGEPGAGDRLDCLLLDVTAGELTVVGTDRYRLGARSLRVTEFDGPDRRLPVSATRLVAVSDWLRRQRRIRVHYTDAALLITPDHDQPDAADGSTDQAEQRLPVADDHFPDYRRVLDSTAQSAGRHRMIIDRIRLLELISADQTSTVVLQPVAEQVLISRVNDPEVRRLPAVCNGPAERVGFSPTLLASALQSSVGPDVLIELAPGSAAVVRSADDGSFSTLVMPRRLDDQPDPDERPADDVGPA